MCIRDRSSNFQFHCRNGSRLLRILKSAAFSGCKKVSTNRPFFSIQILIFSSKINSQVIWNLLFEPLIGNFISDMKFMIWICFLWQLISCQTLKKDLKSMFEKKNQITDWKLESCWINLIWNLLLDLTWFCFCCLWCKIILTVDFHVTEKEGLI